jgi:hypothetical protein
MPDPSILSVGDLVRFVALPREWLKPDCVIAREDIQFMKAMLKRAWPSRVVNIDEYGVPWIYARVRERGKLRLHSWGILESSGWRRVNRRG